MEASDIMTIKEGAEKLRCSYGKLFKMVKECQIESFTVGNQHRLTGKAILDYIEKNSNGVKP